MSVRGAIALFITYAETDYTETEQVNWLSTALTDARRLSRLARVGLSLPHAAIVAPLAFGEARSPAPSSPRSTPRP